MHCYPQQQALTHAELGFVISRNFRTSLKCSTIVDFIKDVPTQALA